MSDSETELLNWTDLPEELGPDFVSHNGDYDYPLYLSEKEEWVNFRDRKFKGNVIVSEPFLIIELDRLVPYLDGKRVKFHPLNMPFIRIGKIEIMGFVVAISEDARFYQYDVDDGTGTITVFYERKLFEATVDAREQIDARYNRYANKIDIKLLKVQDPPQKFPEVRPNFNYSEGTDLKDKLILEHNWSLETNNGTLGERIKQKNYIHVAGYCTLDFLCGKRPQKEITFKDLINSKLNFLAAKITRISEEEYNKKMLLWMQTVVRRRYDEQPNQPESIPKFNDVRIPTRRAQF